MRARTQRAVDQPMIIRALECSADPLASPGVR